MMEQLLLCDDGTRTACSLLITPLATTYPWVRQCSRSSSLRIGIGPMRFLAVRDGQKRAQRGCSTAMPIAI
eukprot:SAG31_NODE_21463_length_549_cov_0.691111_1_plen_70_part_10